MTKEIQFNLFCLKTYNSLTILFVFSFSIPHIVHTHSLPSPPPFSTPRSLSSSGCVHTRVYFGLRVKMHTCAMVAFEIYTRCLSTQHLFVHNISFYPSLSRSPSLALPLSLSLSRSPSLALPLSLSLSRSRSLALPLSLSLSRSPSLALPLSCYLSLSLSLSDFFFTFALSVSES